MASQLLPLRLRLPWGGAALSATRRNRALLVENEHSLPAGCLSGPLRKTVIDSMVVRYVSRGYLGVSTGLFVLNSSKELFEAGVTDEVAIRIRGPIDVQERIFKEHAYSWVSLVGTYRVKAKAGTTDDLLLGEIFAPLEVRSIMSPLELRRQSFDEVFLDLDDLK